MTDSYCIATDVSDGYLACTTVSIVSHDDLNGSLELI